MLEALPPIFSAPTSESEKDAGREILLDYDPPGSEATKAEVLAAPTFKGIYKIRNGMPPITVDNAISLEMEMSQEGSTRRFCLRSCLLAPGADELHAPVAVILPSTAGEMPSDHCRQNHYLGVYRLRIVRMARILNDSPSREELDATKTSDFAVAVAVDVPIAQQSNAHEKTLRGSEPGTRSMRVKRPLEVGESAEVWLSTRSLRDRHLVVGRSEEDQLDIRLSSEAVHAGDVARLSDSKGDWEEALMTPLKEDGDDLFLWHLSLDILRLGDTEAHACTELNYRDRKMVSCGAMRPENRTKTRLGKSCVCGDYLVQIRERCGSLMEMGVSGRRVDDATSRRGDEKEEEKEEEEEVDWEQYDEMEEGRTRVVQTAYPILHFGVLLHISRREAKDAEEEAWAKLLE